MTGPSAKPVNTEDRPMPTKYTVIMPGPDQRSASQPASGLPRPNMIVAGVNSSASSP